MSSIALKRNLKIALIAGIIAAALTFFMTDGGGALHGYPRYWFSEIPIFGEKLILGGLLFDVLVWSALVFLGLAIGIKKSISITAVAAGFMLLFMPALLIDNSPYPFKPSIAEVAQKISVNKEGMENLVRSDMDEIFESPYIMCEENAPPLIPKQLILKNYNYEDDYWLTQCEEKVSADGCDVWTDGTKISHLSIFGDLEVRSGSREGENINYYYNFEPFRYFRQIADDSGNVIGQIEFSINLVLEPTSKTTPNLAESPGEIIVYRHFDVVGFSFLSCNWNG